MTAREPSKHTNEDGLLNGSTLWGVTGLSIAVFGSAGRIGKACCAALATAGARVWALDINSDALDALADESWWTADCAGLCTNAANRSEVIEFRNRLLASEADLDGFVNASYPHIERDPDGFPADVISVVEPLTRHLEAFIAPMLTLADYFANRQSGSIVNVSSIYGSSAPRFELYAETSMTTHLDYAMSKAAIEAMTRYFAQRYLRNGVRYNAVAPGGVRDGQPATFAQRYDEMCGQIGLLEPGHVAGPILNLLARESAAITGQVLLVDDGWTL